MISAGGRLPAVALLLVGAAACGGSGGHLTEHVRSERPEGPAAHPLDTTSRYPLQGVSALHVVKVERLDPRALGADTLDPAFRIFRERCSSCHAPPAPSSRTARLWDATIRRMRRSAAEAGLMPWSVSDEAAIRGFLERHAARDTHAR